MTIGQYISNITNDFNALDTDSWISPKFIYYKAIDIANDYMYKSNSGARRFYKLQEGWQPIECITMEEVPVTSCGEIDTYICDKLMKSTKQIPNTFTSSFGNMIKYVSSNNFGGFYDPTTPRQWKAIQNREFKDLRKKYYWLIDNYLYIPIPKGETEYPESIRLEGWFIEPWKAVIMNAQEKCDSCGDNDIPCINVLDQQMPVPENLRNAISETLYKQLAAIYLQIRPDEYPNNNNNEKQDERS